MFVSATIRGQNLFQKTWGWPRTEIFSWAILYSSCPGPILV